MLFNSWEFALFFPIVTVIYYLLPHSFRWAFLLAASSIFYMAFIPAYVLILAVLILVDFAAGLLIERSQGVRRRLWLIVSICFNVGFLAFFKYFNFLNDNLTEIARLLHWNYSLQSLSILLPLGLSFHTFQSMSYTIEVFRGNQKAVTHLGIYALYVMFYPQLVAGPIERPQHLLPQFDEKHSFQYHNVTSGLKLMLWGLFKKVVIADRLAPVVNLVYNDVYQYQGIYLIVATVAFSFQIFCDFSGYSDIAIGAARAMGFRLVKNFNAPYHARSVSEFWRRWHMSLSTWFRDYVYISLGGNRVSAFRWHINLMITFLISGLWHGANWTFFFWGALHGLYMVGAFWTKGYWSKVRNALNLQRFGIDDWLQMVSTFCLVTFAWIFFRSNTLADAFYVVQHLFSFQQFSDFRLYHIGLQRSDLVILACAITGMEIIHRLERRAAFFEIMDQKPVIVRWSVYSLLFWGTFLFGSYNANKFIYFDF